MDTLSRLMRETSELAADAPVPAPNDADTPAQVAWRRGRRRRIGRALAAAATTLAALAVVVALLTTSVLRDDRTLPASNDSPVRSLEHFPQRIGHQLWVRPLSERPGPMAAVLQRSGDDAPRWEVVSPSGRRHALPLADGDCCDTYPVLSDDGRRLAYLQPALDRLVVQDLVTGATWLDTRIGAPRTTGPDGPEPATPRAHQWSSQSPGWFSPSGGYLALPTFDGPLVLDVGGDNEWVVPGMERAAGWLDDFRLVGRTAIPTRPGTLDEATQLEIVVWDRRTGVTSSLGMVDLTTAVVPVATRGQWWGSVRSDGTLWVAFDEAGSSEVGLLGGLSLPGLRPVNLTGEPVTRMQWSEADLGGTNLLWRGEVPFALLGAEGPELRPALHSSAGNPVVVVEDGLDVRPVAWAADALNAAPSPSPVGTSTSWWAWRWRELMVVVALALGALVWRMRRRTRMAE